MQKAAKVLFYIVAAFYGYGALVHILNIAGLGGFNWINAPLKWQVLDVVYLVIDLIVCIGFLLRWAPSLAAFILAAVSQIALYTVFRAWIVQVPAEYAMTSEQEHSLTLLVAFHIVTLVSVALAYKIAGRAYFGSIGRS